MGIRIIIKLDQIPGAHLVLCSHPIDSTRPERAASAITSGAFSARVRSIFGDLWLHELILAGELLPDSCDSVQE